MGLSSRKHILPAPTESLIDSGVEDTGPSTEIATDLSRRTDRTSATIPDDGSPVTISTGPQIKSSEKSAKIGNLSQASLLIEYYEGQKEPGSNRRPSLRVRVRPSAGRGKDTTEGYLAVTREQGSRKASHTQRIPLGARIVNSGAESVSSLGSEPVDIEIEGKRSDMSEFSASPEARYIIATSDISSMPADSMLGTHSAVAPAPPIDTTSSILSNSELGEGSELKVPLFPRDRNRSHEKIAQKAIEKMNSRERQSSKSLHSEKSRSRSGSASHEVRTVPSHERRRKSGKIYPTESSISGGTESMLSNSIVSAGGKSLDERSVRSGGSSITNPKLLQTVEDAIRRLILPELKEIKRNGSQRIRHKEEIYDELSDNSIAQEKASARRVSSGSRSRRRVSKESGSGSRHRHYRDQDLDDDSLSEISSHNRESISSNSADFKKSNEKTRGRDLAAGAFAGGTLTAAALHHQDSASTLERKRRRKRSKSHSSRSASVAESEDTFEKHAVPPMPFRSEIGSEITRSSLLSSNTADTATPTQNDVREVIRGSPLTGNSASEPTPNQTGGDLRHSLGTYHRNVSGQDLGVHRDSYESQSARGYSPEIYHDQPYATTGILADPERLKAYERNLHQQHPIRRGLSPIQSVASYATTEPHRHSAVYTRSMESMSSLKRRQELKDEVSMDSFMSASPSIQQHGRPRGINLENRNEALHGTYAGQDSDADEFYDEQHNENDKYRYSFGDPKIDVRHLTNYIDDSMDASHLDKVASGQQVAEGFAANPEYVNTPPGVESAVASLIEPSVLSIAHPQSPAQSATESIGHDRTSLHSSIRDVHMIKSASPLKEQISIQSPSTLGKSHTVGNSPLQSPARSFNGSKNDVLNVPQSSTKSATSPESEITTNPSVIHGPIGGLASNRDHWPYAPTPERAIPNNPAQQALNRDLGIHAPDLIPEGLKLGQRPNFGSKPDIYVAGEMTPTGVKDEGYATGDNPRSPGLYAKQKDRPYTPDELDDPFITKRNKYMSGLSQGMSPLYDNATGRGKDQIQSKDVIALMDHLTVRDSQRNARDTEILVTLVRTAAEMRNSFEDMKKFIAEQDEVIMSTAERQHEKTQKVIGGPRPQPTPSRAMQKSIVTQEEDLPAKRRNIFKRALQGLGSKNANELQNIEQMLMQLLDDVEDLRVLQTSGHQSLTPANDLRSDSIGSTENGRLPTDTGYEPEGQAGTSSTGDRSGNHSNQSSRHEYRVISGQQAGNRVSTVMEGDEEDEEYDIYDAPNNRDIDRRTALASHQVESQYRHSHGQTAHEDTPSKNDYSHGTWGNSTPRSADPASTRKHKSITSAFLPKLMSRWSKTTASTEPRFSTQTKPRPYSQVSRSGSDLAEYTYEPQPGDRLRSNNSLQNEVYGDEENRPPSPLIPSQVSDNPKYQGYRNSINLQHPQPRQGPTERYQNQLENEAQNYHDQFSPASQTSSQWEAQFVGHDPSKSKSDRYQPQPPLSPISDGGYSAASNKRHTRIVDDEPLVPQRPPKVPMSPSNYVDHVTAARAGSPAYDKSPAAAIRSPQGSGRKPSGPRPLNGTSQSGQSFKGDMNAVKKTRFRGSPYQISSNEDVSYGY